MMTPQLQEAVHAAQDRKALDLSVLDLEKTCSFTSYFLICSGTSTRHAQAICDAIAEKLEKRGFTPAHIEGYSQAEWILMDYLNFVVHIFLERADTFMILNACGRMRHGCPFRSRAKVACEFASSGKERQKTHTCEPSSLSWSAGSNTLPD